MTHGMVGRRMTGVVAVGCSLILCIACGDAREIDDERDPRRLTSSYENDEIAQSDDVASSAPRALRPDHVASPIPRAMPSDEAVSPTPRGPLADTPAMEGFKDYRSGGVEVLVTSAGDVPLLIPSVVIVAEGTRSIGVRNVSGQDQIFAIEGDTLRETRVPAGGQVTVQLDEMEPSAIYGIVLREEPSVGGVADGVRDPAEARRAEGAERDDPAVGSRGATDEQERPVDPDPSGSGTAEIRAPASGTLVVLPGGPATGARAAGTDRDLDPIPATPSSERRDAPSEARSDIQKPREGEEVMPDPQKPKDGRDRQSDEDARRKSERDRKPETFRPEREEGRQREQRQQSQR